MLNDWFSTLWNSTATFQIVRSRLLERVKLPQMLQRHTTFHSDHLWSHYNLKTPHNKLHSARANLPIFDFDGLSFGQPSCIFYVFAWQELSKELSRQEASLETWSLVSTLILNWNRVIWLIWNCDAEIVQTCGGEGAWIGRIWNLISSTNSVEHRIADLQVGVAHSAWFFREFLVDTIYLKGGRTFQACSECRQGTKCSHSKVLLSINRNEEFTASLVAQVLNFMPAISGLMISTQNGLSFFIACFRHWIGDSYCSLLMSLVATHSVTDAW